MFEPFTQEDTANSKGAGSGLGLSIVKSIVDAMNGTIEVHSKKGEGTTFTIKLVLEPCETPSTKTERLSNSSKVLAGRHALICEDNELNMEIEASILTKAGMEVTKAADGKQGVEAFEKSSEGYYDIILMDLRMPVMDGLEAAKQIRAMKRRDADTVLIYAVSADAFSENVADAMNAGMDGHIAKPIHAELLIQTLAKAIEKGI
jgi:CheY-like chemotaxis protein